MSESQACFRLNYAYAAMALHMAVFGAALVRVPGS
jgi:hypothetical protein